ncbi:DNA-3-methyladenine glycosylase family protein [Jatrophihabitans sp.]|uniref:DNA-3-methyladenine glycosylase family protein n=1 Tax=Jatrophihabitans sp. TaxID=1932789 RepID=UPI002F024700
MNSTPVAELRWQPPAPLDLARTLRPLRHGAGDPVARFVDATFWWACRTPDGPGTLALTPDGGQVLARAWGDGAHWLLAAVPGLLGAGDDWSELDVSGHPVLRQVHRERPGVRLARTGRVLDSLVPACLEQRVTGQEAFRAWRLLTWAYGEPAPGPAEPRLWLPAEPARLLAVPSWDWHRFGVDSKRYQAVRAAATVANRLEECVGLAAGQGLTPSEGMAAARRRLAVVPGVGPWTVAETSLRALGDPDAVSVGDFHLSNVVGYVLTGAARTDDATMLELLEPWAGQRARVIRLIELSGLMPPKYGPRFSPKDMSRI